MTAGPLEAVPRTSFRLPFGIGFTEPLRAESYDSENVIVGRTAVNAGPSAIFLGKLAEFQHMRRNVWLDCQGAHAIYVMGKRRSGKSHTLGVVCEGLVAGNWLRLGQPDQAVLLIDTLNIYGALHVAAEAQAAGPYEYAGWQLPPYTPQVRYVATESARATIAADSRRLTVDPAWLTVEDWCAFFDLDLFADPLGHLLSVVVESAKRRWAAEASTASRGSGIDDMLWVLDCNADAKQFESATRDALRRRLLALDRLKFLLRPSPPVEDLLTPGTITVCQVRDLDDRLRALVVAVLVRDIMRSRSRSDANLRLLAARAGMGTASSSPQTVGGLARCWVIIDEAHNYLPASGTLPSRPVLRRLITEGRNIGLSVVVATQEPSGLDSSIRRNADALLIHSMSMRDDIAAAEGMINTHVPDSASWGTTEKTSGRVFERLVRSLPQGYCVVSTDTANRIFGLRVRPRTTMHGGDSY